MDPGLEIRVTGLVFGGQPEEISVEQYAVKVDPDVFCRALCFFLVVGSLANFDWRACFWRLERTRACRTIAVSHLLHLPPSKAGQ
jgi:hypothetical protein